MFHSFQLRGEGGEYFGFRMSDFELQGKDLEWPRAMVVNSCCPSLRWLAPLGPFTREGEPREQDGWRR